MNILNKFNEAINDALTKKIAKYSKYTNKKYKKLKLHSKSAKSDKLNKPDTPDYYPSSSKSPALKGDGDGNIAGVPAVI